MSESSARRKITYFLSYAHADEADVRRFLEVMEPQLQTSAEFDFQLWSDRHIRLGEKWKPEIEAALADSAFGLLLVSPRFLGSRFIVQNELPALLSKSLVVPVGLHRLLFDGSMDLKGLGERQLFLDGKRRPFDACRTMVARRDFALELFSRIRGQLMEAARLAREAPAVPPQAPAAPPIRPRNEASTRTPHAGGPAALIVEAEAGIRILMEKILLREGYVTLGASSGEEAAQILEAHQGPIRVVIADTPRVQGGLALATGVRGMHVDARAVLIEGYEERDVAHPLPEWAVILKKPFTLEELLRAVRDVLRRPPAETQ